MTDYIKSILEVFGITQHLKLWIHGDGGNSDRGIVGIIDRFLNYLSETDFSGPDFSILPGLADMANIHPLVVHFPIALLSCFLVLEIFSSLLKSHNLHVASTWMLYAGTIGAFVSVAAGLLAEATIQHGGAVHEVVENHKILGISVLVLASVLSLWRIIYTRRLSGMASMLNLLLAAVMVSLLTIGADLGGQMVYKYGLGVAGIEQPNEHPHKISHY